MEIDKAQSNSSSKKFGKRYDLETFKSKLNHLLTDNPNGLNINQVSSQLNMNRNTVSKYLKTLQATKDVMSRKIGVATLWYNSNKSNQTISGPNVITIKLKSKEFLEIVKVNKIYHQTIKEIPESLIGSNLWNFFPFKQFKVKIEPFILNSIENLSKSNTPFKKIYELENEVNNTVSSIEISTHYYDKETNYITIEYHDITLQTEREKELINTGTFDILMNFSEEYLSIQTHDYKVLKANNKVLEKFNNNKQILSSETVYCFDLYHKRDKPCDGCPVKEAISTDNIVSTKIKHKNLGTLGYTVFPIHSKNGMDGYILKITES